MKYRKLRITFSAVCGVLCLLLLVLWVRSYWRVDKLERSSATNTNNGWRVCLFNGRLYVRVGMGGGSNNELQWTLSRPPEEAPTYYYNDVLGFSIRPPKYYSIPIWFAALTVGGLAVAPWPKQAALGIIHAIRNVPRRFSLRTLLIATTIVAVGLGLAVWAASN
jgi:hypothetical protein